MKIAYDGPNPDLKAAAKFVNQLGANEGFWREIREKNDFTHTDVDPGDIEAQLRGNTSAMSVRIWRPNLLQRVAYRNTVAFADARFPHVLFYHEKFIGNSVGQMVNTLVHEYIHDVDEQGELGHEDNDPRGKENSVPYWIGNLAERLYNEAAGLGSKVEGLELFHRRGSASDGAVV